MLLRLSKVILNSCNRVHLKTNSYCLAILSKNKSIKSSSGLQSEFTQMTADNKKVATNGRSWRAEQLRLKSNEDLHKLWFVCVKEKNLLLADQIIQKKMSEDGSSTLDHRIQKVKLTMKRILGVVHEREKIRKHYREQLEKQYIRNKKQQLEAKVQQNSKDQLPQITKQMLRSKYHELRKGIDNVKYLERIYQAKQNAEGRKQRMEERLSKLDKDMKFTSFWKHQMSIGQRPLQQEILRTQITNWKSLNLKQRKIILGFLNARRSRDAKDTFLKQLKILGEAIAHKQMNERIKSS